MDIGPALSLLEDLKARGELFLSLSPPYQASFEIDRQVLRRTLADKTISEKEFQTAATRISSMLLAVMSDNVENYVVRDRHIHDDDNEEDEQGSSQESQEQRREQIEMVKTALWDQHIQGRYDLKRSSKAPSFTDIDWDIKVKRLDAHLESLKPFPYATCRISFQREFGDSPFAVIGGRMFDSVQINLTLDEVSYMIRVLSTVKDHLSSIEDEGGS